MVAQSNVGMLFSAIILYYIPYAVSGVDKTSDDAIISKGIRDSDVFYGIIKCMIARGVHHSIITA